MPIAVQEMLAAIWIIGGTVTAATVFAWLWFRCRHAWTLVSDREFPSRGEELTKSGITISSLWISDIPKLGSKVYIAVVKCDKCGAIKTFKEHS